MRVILYFNSQSDIIIKPNYQHELQALIYNNIDKEIASNIHDFKNKKDRTYKYFTFSYIFSNNTKYDNVNKNINFGKEIYFIFSTINEELFKSLIKTLKFNPNVYISNNKLRLSKIKICNSFNFNTSQKITMMSPIVIYSTENNKTRYYNPNDKEFSEQIKNNIIRKYKACYNNFNDDNFEIFQINNIKKEITNYKGFIIEGYLGNFEIKSSKELIQLSYEVGLGSKNSQGFGLWL